MEVKGSLSATTIKDSSFKNKTKTFTAHKVDTVVREKILSIHYQTTLKGLTRKINIKYDVEQFLIT